MLAGLSCFLIILAICHIEGMRAKQIKHRIKLVKTEYNQPLPNVTLYGRITSKIPITTFLSSQYLAVVSIGTPAQLFKLAIDTGSSDLWVVSNKCKKLLACRFRRRKYDAKASSTYINQNYTVELNYAQGTVYVNAISEDIKLFNFLIKNQTIGEATKLPITFFNMRSDGIMGLGFPSLSVFNENTLFSQLINQYQSVSPLFSIYYRRKIDENGYGGELVIGGYDYEHTVEPFKTVKVLHEKHWTFHIDIIQYNNITMCEDGCIGVIDTGSSVILAPEKYVDMLKLAMHTPPEYKYLPLILPNITKEFLSSVLTLKTNGYNLNLSAIDLLTNENSNMVYIMDFDIQEYKKPTWVFGIPFLKKYYTIFDVGNKAMHFAETKDT